MISSTYFSLSRSRIQSFSVLFKPFRWIISASYFASPEKKWWREKSHKLYCFKCIRDIFFDCINNGNEREPVETIFQSEYLWATKPAFECLTSLPYSPQCKHTHQQSFALSPHTRSYTRNIFRSFVRFAIRIYCFNGFIITFLYNLLFYNRPDAWKMVCFSEYKVKIIHPYVCGSACISWIASE